jgi:hypothetical protein
MVPGKSFLIAGVLALSGIMAGVLALPRGPTPAPAASAPVVTKAVFGERFDWPLLKKQDRLPLPPAPKEDPVPVQAETVVMTQPDDLIDVKKKAEPKKKEKPTRTASAEHHDVCRRHHMHKVMTHGGRSWRCRR